MPKNRIGRGTAGSAPGLVAQLRDPPGGRDGRTMLHALLLDRTGSGMWSAVAVLYFTYVVGLQARQVGLLLGIAGAAAIAGPPLAGRLAARRQVRSILVGAHGVRLAAACLLLACGSFATLLPAVTVITVADRVARTMETLYATRAAGEQRATYRALSRVMMNAGYALGAAIAALGLAVGTHGAYVALVLGNALSYLLAGALVFRTREVSVPSPNTGAGVRGPHGRSPWRDPGYLLFALLDTPLNVDDAVLNVGLPLWLVSRTSAPHAVVPAFLIANTVLVVLLQLRVSARISTPRAAARAVVGYGAAMSVCCVLVALAPGGGAAVSALLLLAAALAVTAAELVRSVTSWELAVCLAPAPAPPEYLGVAGVSQAVGRSAGPPLLTGAVMAAGPVGWLALAAGVTGVSVLQRRAALRRLASMPPLAPGVSVQPAPSAPTAAMSPAERQNARTSPRP
jgi:hypothetical protein